jgi:hypothetical protein
MVLDLGKDHYHLQGEALRALGDKVRHGNMEDVLKVYEEEMKVCSFLGFVTMLLRWLCSRHSRMQ